MENGNLWVINMIFCILIGFGSFGYALKLTMDAENKKRGKE